MPNAAIWSGSGCGCSLTQAFQRADHRVAARQLRAAGVGAEFALAREPHDDHARENAEHELRDDHGDEERRTVAALGLEHDAVDRRSR